MLGFGNVNRYQNVGPCSRVCCCHAWLLLRLVFFEQNHHTPGKAEHDELTFEGTMARNSSTMICCAIASNSASPSRALGLIARMTTAMSNKRTIQWSGKRSAINVSTRRRN